MEMVTSSGLVLPLAVRALLWHLDGESLKGMGDRVGFSSCHACSGSWSRMILMIQQNKDLNLGTSAAMLLPELSDYSLLPCSSQETVGDSIPLPPIKDFFFFSFSAILNYDGVFTSLKIFQTA